MVVAQAGAGAAARPILIGGAPGRSCSPQIAEYGDGWIPIGGAGVRAALPELHAAFEAAGRDPTDAADRARSAPLPDPGKLEYYESIGIDEVVLRVPNGDADEILPVLDDYAALG